MSNLSIQRFFCENVDTAAPESRFPVYWLAGVLTSSGIRHTWFSDAPAMYTQWLGLCALKSSQCTLTHKQTNIRKHMLESCRNSKGRACTVQYLYSWQQKKKWLKHRDGHPPTTTACWRNAWGSSVLSSTATYEAYHGWKTHLQTCTEGG